MKKRFLAAVLALAMLLMMVPSAFAASDGFDDVPGHWAEDAINRWSGYGVVNGVGDNQFAPNGTLTRAQAAQVFANLLDLEVQADISRYTDVPEGSWYHTAIAQCVAAGILTGTGGSTMDPQSPVTREELFVMFARALNIRPQSSSDVTFGDSGEVSGWAQGYINALADRGFVSGVGGGMLAPGEAINRASVMSLLDKTISDYANTSGTTVGNASGVVLVVADNVSVAGDVDTLVVYGGSASVTGSQVAEAAVAGENASLSVSGSAVVERVDVAGTEAVLTLTGSVRAGQVTVSGESAQVSLSGQAQAASVAVEETAAGAGLTVGAGSAVTTVDSAAANVTISGSGTVETANVSGNNTTVNTDGTDLTVSQGTTGVTENNKPVSGGSTVETQPEQPVTPPIYIPNYYTVTFVNTDKEMIVSQTVVEHTTDLSDLAPDVTVGDGQQLKWHNGTSYVELSEVTVTSNLTLTAVVGSNAFTAGNGTEEYPYQIANLEQFYAINDLSTAMAGGTEYYFEQTADINGITNYGGAKYVVASFCGEYNGNGRSITAAEVEGTALFLFNQTYGDVVVENLTLVSTDSLGLSVTVDPWHVTNLTIANVNAEVLDNATLNLTDQSNFAFLITGAIFNSTEGNQTITIDNCHINASVQNTGTCTGGFIGSGYYPNRTGDNTYLVEGSPIVTIRNSSMTGDIVGQTQAGLITGNSAYNSHTTAMLSAIEDEDEREATARNLMRVENVTFNGTITATYADVFSDYGATGANEFIFNALYAEAIQGEWEIGNRSSNPLENMNLELYKTDSGYATNGAEGYTFTLAFNVQAIEISNVVMNGRNVLIPLEIVESDTGNTKVKTGSNIHAYDVDTAITKRIIKSGEELDYSYDCEGGFDVAIVTSGDNTYLIFADPDNTVTVDSSVITEIYGYQDGVYVGSVRINQN